MDHPPTLLQRIYEMLMESQYWPQEQMLAYQRSQLGQLLRHAKATVPFYKTRLDAVFKRNGDIDWNRWQEIPIVTRADLRDNYGAMLAATLPPGHGPAKTHRSSGSSGIPIAIETTAMQARVNEAAILRFIDNQNMDTRKTRAWVAHKNRKGELLREEYQVGGWGKPWESRDRIGRIYVMNRAMTEARKLELLRSLGVSDLQDVTNNAELTANANLALDNPVRLETVTCRSQKLTQAQRDLFRRSFGARSLSIYSSKEGGFMGCQCGDTTSLHVMQENILIEILDDEGQPCAPGELGRVIVTPFFGAALPLIRYDQGDWAELSQSCVCGMAVPAFTSITGRQDQMLKLPDGPRVVGALFQVLLDEKLDVLAFQLAQTASLKLEFRYIPANKVTKLATAPVIAHIQAYTHPEIEVVFKPVDKLPLNSGEKLQRVICEID